MKERLKNTLLLTAPLTCAMTCYLLWLLYDNILTRFVPPCFAWTFAHIYCPGCGGTRAVRVMAEGHFWLSVRCNPLPMLGLLTAFGFWAELLFSRFGKPKKIIPRSGWFWYTVLGMFLLWSILRNFFPVLRPPV